MLTRWSSVLTLFKARTTFFFCCYAAKESLCGKSAMWNWKVYISWKLKIHKLCMTGFYYALSTCSTRNILEARVERNKLFGTAYVKRILWIFKKHNYYWQPHLFSIIQRMWLEEKVTKMFCLKSNVSSPHLHLCQIPS